MDRIVEREELRNVLAQILEMHRADRNADGAAEKVQDGSAAETSVPEHAGETHGFSAHHLKESALSAWDRVQLSRRKDRPVGTDYIDALFTDFMEFHGDRYFKDDHAVVGGIAYFHGMPVTVIAPGEGKDNKRKSGPKLLHAFSGRIPQGAAADEAGGEIRTSGHLLRGYSGSVLRT